MQDETSVGAASVEIDGTEYTFAGELEREPAIRAARAASPISFDTRVNALDDRSPYTVKSSESYFADLYASSRGDAGALDRLRIHGEQRDLTSTDGAGGDFVPPQHLVTEWIEAVRGSGPFIATLKDSGLPEGGDVVNVPRFNTGATVAAQQDGGSVSETDPVTDTIAANVITVAGFVDTSVQVFERSVPGLDSVLVQDLSRAYTDKLDSLAINGTGSSGQPEGLVNADGGSAISYTDASPTFGELASKIQQAVATVATARKLPPTHLLLHPRRLAFIAKELDTTNRPMAVVENQGPTNAGAVLAGPTAEGIGGTLAGLTLVSDPNIVTTSGAGTNEDTLFVYRPDDIYWATNGVPKLEVFRDSLSSTLQVRIRAYGFSAFTAERRPESFASITGTGLAAWF